MSEIRRVNTGDAPRNVYHAGDAPRTVNTGRTVKTGSALNQDEYEAARRRAQQLAANNTRRTRSFNRVQQTDVDRYRAAQQKEQEARAAAAQQQAQEAHAAREAAARQQAQAAAQSEQPLTRAQRQALELQRRARSQSAQGATRTQVRRLDLNETKGSRAHYDMNADAEYQIRQSADFWESSVSIRISSISLQESSSKIPLLINNTLSSGFSSTGFSHTSISWKPSCPR